MPRSPQRLRGELEVSSPSAPVVPDETPENEFEDPVLRDPEEVPGEPDPFAQMLDDMLKSDGIDVELEKRRKYNPAVGNIQEHDWQTHRESMFSNEPYIFRCKRCLKFVEVQREQTINEALSSLEIDPNCANQVIQGIMNA